jgi:addiction module HigA family antidote
MTSTRLAGFPDGSCIPQRRLEKVLELDRHGQLAFDFPIRREDKRRQQHRLDRLPLGGRMPMKSPPHPGDLIRTEIIEPLGLNVSRAADILKVRRATLSDLLRGKAALTPEMALRIEKAFGPDMNHLLRMQLAYDVAKTRQQSGDIAVKRFVVSEGKRSPARR